MITSFFTWFAGVLSDPNDKQGSSKRLCLFLVVITILLLIVVIVAIKRELPVIPESLLNLVYFLVITFTGGMVADKGIAAYKTVKGADNAETTAA